jgi:hypothetical protein
MPKRLTPLRPGWATDDKILERCVKKAGAAAGKNSPLTDSEILFVSKIASDAYSLCEGWPLANESGHLPKISSNDLCPEKSRRLAWIFARDPAGAARAVQAAKRESDHIEATALWAVRRVIRHLSIIKTIPLPSMARLKFDRQAICESVKRQTGFTVSAALIKKAFREERKIDAQKK